MTRFLSILALAFVPTTGQAQNLQFSTELSLSCYYESGDLGDPHGCIGLSANQCMDTTPGGYSTIGMGACYNAELQMWDEMLNATYQELAAWDRHVDTQSGGSRAASLQAMQRAWIGFRDASCAYEYAQWGGGTGGGPAYTACVMHLTGQQAMSLDVHLMQNQAD